MLCYCEITFQSSWRFPRLSRCYKKKNVLKATFQESCYNTLWINVLCGANYLLHNHNATKCYFFSKRYELAQLYKNVLMAWAGKSSCEF